MMYRIYNLALRSNIPLPELRDASCRRSDCEFTLLRNTPLRVGRGARWRRHWQIGGRPWLSVVDHRAAHVLRFHRLADFVVSGHPRQIACHADPKTPRDTIRHLLLDHVIPLVLSDGGHVVLHGSAIKVGGSGVAFLGPGGAGKSTLAASFGASGAGLLADDGVLVERRGRRIVAIPAYAGLRLWPETVADIGLRRGARRPGAYDRTKQRIGPGQSRLSFLVRPVPLRLAYVLVAPGPRQRRVVIEPLSRRDGVVELVKQAYRLDFTRRDQLANQLQQLSRISGTLELRRLRVPRGLTRLSEVRRAILVDLAGEPVPAALDRTGRAGELMVSE